MVLLTFKIRGRKSDRNVQFRLQKEFKIYCHVFCVCVTNNNGFWIGWLDLLALLYNYNQLWRFAINDCLRLAPFLTGLRVFSSVTNDERRISPEWILLSVKSKSKLHCDWRSVRKSCPSGAHDQIFVTVWQLRSCCCGAPSLTRKRVCLLYILLALASAVFLRSVSIGTRDHILLSRIWDFPFRRLLRLAGSRWRYSTPPPHRYPPPHHSCSSLYSLGTDRIENTPPNSSIVSSRGYRSDRVESTIPMLQFTTIT
jgi:hypothetical protein